MRRISLKNCPYCGSSKVYVSGPQVLWEKVYTVFLLRFARCHVCLHRHLRIPFFPAPKRPDERDPLN
jgi:hypothetical protein